jgi:hypothetical protein
MDKSIPRRSLAACAALLAAALAVPGLAQQGAGASDRIAETGSDPMTCLNQAEIRRARILSNRNIVFVTRFDEIYNNQLPKECPGLQRNSLVNYPVTSGRLCAGDRFQVLWEQQPGNYVPAALCPLGRFVPITATELEDLMTMTETNRGRRQRGRSTREAVTTQQVELPAAATSPAEPPPDADDPSPAE